MEEDFAWVLKNDTIGMSLTFCGKVFHSLAPVIVKLLL